MANTTTIQTIFALEKVKRNPNLNYIIYAYILPETQPNPAKPVGYFIPIDVTTSEKEADDRIKEIIELTGYSDLWRFPMGKWISLGDPVNEKIFLHEIRDNLKEYAKKEDERKIELAKERRRIEAEIKAEQEAIQDPETIESYYYDWFCLVQNETHLQALEKDVAYTQEMCKKRIDNIKSKEINHPEFKDTWQDLFRDRLDRRQEANEAAYVIEEAKRIRSEKNF